LWSCPGFHWRFIRYRESRPPYSAEFRRQTIDLVRAGSEPEDLAREFEPTSQPIRKWDARADRKEGLREERSVAVTLPERDELIRSRREKEQLRLECDILSRAAA
jgi:transposase